jgi:hypothetical protein
MYDHTTDPTAFLVLDDRSPFTTTGGVGTQVTSWANVSASALAYNAVQGAGSGIAALQADGSGYKYVHFDGACCLKIPTSSGFDAEFTNSGNSGGNTTLIVFDLDGTTQGWLVNKGSTSGTFVSNSGVVQAAFFNESSSGANLLCSYQNCYSLRPYTGGPGSVAISNRSQTQFTGSVDFYQDGIEIYLNGARTTCTEKGGGWNLAADNGHDFTIGGLGWATAAYNVVGKIRAVVCWNRAAKHHEILATHRYYAARYGMAETLTNQPFALIADSNSESTVPQGTGGVGSAYNGEVGLFDRVAPACGIGLDACHMLGRGGRSTSQMIHDFPTDVAPLIEYLQSLGLPVAVHLWEGINDSYVASHYVDYRNLIAALPSPPAFSVGDCFSRDAEGTRIGIDSNPIVSFNAQVLADGATYGYPVARLGANATLASMGITNAGHFDPTYESDGLHWLTAAIAVGVPITTAAVQASLVSTSIVPILMGTYRRRRAS